MNGRRRFRGARWWLLGGTVACVLAIAGCQDGVGPDLLTGPGPKLGEEGAKPQPPQPPADPAIVFKVRERTHGQVSHRIKVMNADGSNVTALHTMVSGAICFPSWSPDGASITFCDQAPDLQGYNVMRIDVSIVNGVPVGTNLTTLVNRTSYMSESLWSPVGDQIAFWDWDLRTLELIPAGGGTPEVLYTSIGSYHWSTWNRDGSQVIFSERDPAGGQAIRAVDVAAPHAVTTLLGLEFSQQHGNADIRWLDHARTMNVLAFECAGDPAGSVYTLDLLGGVPSLVVGAVGAPTWSPDDSTILFTNGNMYKVNLATGVVTDTRVSGSYPDWRKF
jgi:dipeptidyl aminopeptidase/acylaminoacyl peptidase